MALSGTLAINVEFEQTNSLDLVEATAALSNRTSFSISDGPDENECEYMFSDTRTLGASASENLDPATGGGLTDAFAAAIAMTKLKCIIVKASSENTNNVVVSRPGSNGIPFLSAAGDSFAVLPGQMMVLTCFSTAGWTVTPDTGDLITITNSAGDTGVTYDIILLGSGASA